MANLYETRDKQIVPFLLIQPGISFVGTRKDGSIIYFQFESRDKCNQLVNLFLSKKASPVQPKDLLDAVETFRDRVFEMKEEEKYGGDCS